MRDVVDGEVDWDAFAGEDWATIGHAGVAYAQVYLLAPLVIVRSDRSGSMKDQLDSQTRTIVVDDLDESILRSDLGVLTSFFSVTFDLREFDPEGFTPRELWFWTI